MVTWAAVATRNDDGSTDSDPSNRTPSSAATGQPNASQICLSASRASMASILYVGGG